MTLLEEAILEVYKTERERSDDPQYPFDELYIVEKAERGEYLRTMPA